MCASTLILLDLLAVFDTIDSVVSLPQYALCGLAFEDHPNISTGPEYSGMHNFRKPVICPCYSTAMGDALGSSFFPNLIQGVDYHL